MKQLLAVNLCEMIKILIFIFSFPVPLIAQIHSKSQKTISFTGGMMDKFSTKKNDNSAIWLNFSVSKYNSRSGGIRYGLSFQEKYYDTIVQKSVTVNQYLGEVGYGFELAKSYSKRFYLNGYAGGIIGYESINYEQNEIGPALFIQNESRILVGVQIYTEVEMILSTKTSFILNVGQIWTPTSDLQDFHCKVGFGVRLNYF